MLSANRHLSENRLECGSPRAGLKQSYYTTHAYKKKKKKIIINDSQASERKTL